jgi:dipeptidyl aminopeptidase/acylaminoacyl peptidase
VLQAESDAIVEAVIKNGGVVEYVVFPDEGHGFTKRVNKITAYSRILQFLDRYLKRQPEDALRHVASVAN